MSRTRLIKPGFFENEELAECEMAARVLFAGLWCLADREGRLECRPKRIKAKVFPYDDFTSADIERMLDQLAAKGFVRRWRVHETAYLEVSRFAEHQNPHPREAASTIPSPPENGEETEGVAASREKALPSRVKDMPSRAVSNSNSDTVSEREANASLSATSADGTSEAPSASLPNGRGQEARIVEAWNSLATEFSLPRVEVLTAERRGQLRQRIREAGGENEFIAIMNRIRGSPGLLGDNDSGWTADFDFLVRKSRFTKLREGSYDNWGRTTHRRGSAADKQRDAFAAVRRHIDEISGGRG